MEKHFLLDSIRVDLTEKFIVYETAQKRMRLMELYVAGSISLLELNNQW